MTPAAPPSAETVWLRIGYTLETTATLRLRIGLGDGDGRPQARAAAADQHHVMRRGHVVSPSTARRGTRAERNGARGPYDPLLYVKTALVEGPGCSVARVTVSLPPLRLMMSLI